MKTPAAKATLDLARIDAGLDVLIGDPAAIPESIRPTIQIARGAIRDATHTCDRLEKDPTRTPASVEVAKKKVAERALAEVARAHSAVKGLAAALERDAWRAADEHFAPNPQRGSIEADVRAWIRETLRKPNGLDEVKAAAKESHDVASVIYNSPRFLIAMPEAVHTGLRFSLLRERLPQVAANLDKAVDLARLSERYPTTIARLRSALYDAATAEAAEKSRVEV